MYSGSFLGLADYEKRVWFQLSVEERIRVPMVIKIVIQIIQTNYRFGR